MNHRTFLSAASIVALGMTVGCLRSYVVTPLSPASLNKTAKLDSGLEMKTKAFLTKEEINDKFGEKLAEDRQVVPVQVSITNKGAQTFRILRTSFVLLDMNGSAKLNSLNNEEIYQLGRHGYGKPVCGMIFGGILGLPSLITTMNANDRLRDDYSRKLLQDAIVEPGKDTTGVVFFNPEAYKLNRDGKYKMVVELEDTGTNAKSSIEQIIS